MNKLDDERLVVVKGLLEEAVEIRSDYVFFASKCYDDEYHYYSFFHNGTFVNIIHNDEGLIKGTKSIHRTTVAKMKLSGDKTDTLEVVLDFYIDSDKDLGYYISASHRTGEGVQVKLEKDFPKSGNKIIEELDIDALLNEINQ